MDLPAGKVEIRLRDLTGHYSRCDALVLSAGLLPPAGGLGPSLAAGAVGGISRQWKERGPYETVVVGGGLAGTFAAVASARRRCKNGFDSESPRLGWECQRGNPCRAAR